jgi:hypothetical protein
MDSCNGVSPISFYHGINRRAVYLISIVLEVEYEMFYKSYADGLNGCRDLRRRVFPDRTGGRGGQAGGNYRGGF